MSHPVIHLGTCGWGFEDWKGVFYPEGTPSNRWLGFYAGVFNAVEIDATFYATPPAATVGHWLAEAPARFRFCCKAPKEITHERRLRDCQGALQEFLAAMEPLRTRTGAVLVQLPPSFEPAEDSAALRDFVLGLPKHWRFAIEFRHRDWHQPRFAKLLEDHGVSWVWSDMTALQDQAQGPYGFFPETADFLYVRLMGDQRTKFDGAGARRHRTDSVLWQRTAAIESWAVRLLKQAEEGRRVYAFCNNHYEGFAPATCRQLGSLMGVEIGNWPARGDQHGDGSPRQMKLF